MAGTEAGGKKSRRSSLLKNPTSTVKAAERVDRGQKANKTGLHSIGRQLGFAAESANADTKRDDELAEFEKNRTVHRQM